MTTDKKKHVCPAAISWSLDNGIRKWLQNPGKMLGPYIREGMTVLDVGCGPGFFSVEMALMVGDYGRVIAADLQDAMLRKLREKIRGTEIEKRITLHKCEKYSLGISVQVDFVLAFYMVHEITDQESFFREIKSVLKPGARVFIIEPPFHTSAKEFEESLQRAKRSGLEIIDRPKMFLNKAAVLKAC